jgi:hypothetical protein
MPPKKKKSKEKKKICPNCKKPLPQCADCAQLVEQNQELLSQIQRTRGSGIGGNRPSRNDLVRQQQESDKIIKERSQALVAATMQYS